MNPYEAPQTSSQLPLPLATAAKQGPRAWHENPEFVRRNQAAMFVNCLIPWVIAAAELAFALPKRGNVPFDFLPGIVWFLINLIWLGCLLGLSWTQRKQFVQAIFWLLLVSLNFSGAALLRYVFVWTIPTLEFAWASKRYLLVLEVVSALAGIVLGVSFCLTLLLRFRSRLVDNQQAERESRKPASFQWSLGAMIYGTFLIALATAGIILDRQWWKQEPLVYLFSLYLLLLWHELVHRELRWPILNSVIVFGILLHLFQFKKYPWSRANLRDELEFWISFNVMVFAIGLTARWAGWRIVRRPMLPWIWSRKKSSTEIEFSHLGSRNRAAREVS